ncbi:MAG TPA: 4-alpha-glucanotransferase, partial [Actinomycetota bacterium]
PSAVAGSLRRRRERPIEPVLVAWDGRLGDVALGGALAASAAGGRAAVRVEPVDADGGPRDARVAVARDGRLSAGEALGAPLGLGYHRLRVRAGRREATAAVVAAPPTAPGPRAPGWGVFAPLHAVRGPEDRGVGTFTDLERLQAWVGSRGGAVVATLPMLAGFLDEPFEPSPYAPASRLFWNELHVDVARAPGLEDAPEARAALEDPTFRREAAALAAADLVDHRRAIALARRVLAPLAERVLRRPPPAFRRWLAGRDGAADYARFRAEVERTPAWWGAWDRPARDGDLLGDPLDDPAGRYHLYAQWAADLQVERIVRAAREGGAGLVLDLPLGVGGGSYDVWHHRASFATEASAGAPPDAFFTGGQDWGFPPLHPERVREDAYAYPIACLRQLLRSATGVRVDHVMGLHRLYWIPSGAAPTEGAYVRSRPDEWYAILALEATRAGAVVVGEDLGTVPAEVRRAMGRRGVHRSYVLQYELRPGSRPVLPDPPARSLAALNTHDMAPWAAFVRGDDVALSLELGTRTASEARAALAERRAVLAELRAFLRARGFAPGRGRDGMLEASLAFLAASDAAIVVATLEDLWGERRPQNVPGTVDRPNWRGRMRRSLGDLDAAPDVDRVLRRIDAARRGAGGREEGAA